MHEHQNIQTSNRIRIRPWAIGLIVIFVWMWAAPAGAVDAGKTSYTAEAVCAFRSIAAQDPDPKTRNPDHMAKNFVNPDFYQRFPGLGLNYEDAKIAMDRMDSGVFYYVNARTHHMDAMLTDAIKSGTRQVIIMGAGFDSRAYRFHNDFPQVQFFEIDLPATSKDKQQRVEKVLGKRPDWVTYVPIDFNTQTLEEVLGSVDFAQDQKTFFVWEGVTYFISQAGVDNTLRFISEHSPPGSRVVFDYMLEDVVTGKDYSAYGARRTVFYVGHRGEPYVFGIAPQRLENFINMRGLALISDLGPKDLSQRYLMHSDGATSGKIAEFLRIVHAEVPATIEKTRLRRQTEMCAKQLASIVSDSAPHKVAVPDDVQSLLDGHSRAIAIQDFAALQTHFSKNYRANGRTRREVIGFLRRIYRERPVGQYKIVLTRLDPSGDIAIIDGFIQRSGFRLPLMGSQIIKESDGRWRWYGNQQ